jgi:hypothetical protein
MFARGPEEAVNLPRRNQRRSSGDTKLARMSLCLSAICCFGPNIILAKALLTQTLSCWNDSKRYFKKCRRSSAVTVPAGALAVGASSDLQAEFKGLIAPPSIWNTEQRSISSFHLLV